MALNGIKRGSIHVEREQHETCWIFFSLFVGNVRWHRVTCMSIDLDIRVVNLRVCGIRTVRGELYGPRPMVKAAIRYS